MTLALFMGRTCEKQTLYLRRFNQNISVELKSAHPQYCYIDCAPQWPPPGSRRSRIVGVDNESCNCGRPGSTHGSMTFVKYTRAANIVHCAVPVNKDLCRI